MSSPSGINWIFRVYKLFRLNENFSWDTKIKFDKNYEFRDRKKKNKVRMTIDTKGRITVSKGYAWDGCTPKFSFFDFFVVGTPDGILSDRTGKPKAYHASLVHDALYQFLPDLPPEEPVYTRKMADDIFLQILEDAQFAPRRIYWLAVRVFGGLFMNTRKYITRRTDGAVTVMQEPKSKTKKTSKTRKKK